MDWFKNCKTEDEMSRRYKELALKYHPDRGGDTELMQEITQQFMEAKAAKKQSPFERMKTNIRKPNEKLQKQMEIAIEVAKVVSPKAKDLFARAKANPIAQAIVQEVGKDNRWIADLFNKL